MWQRGGTREPDSAEALQPGWAMDWEIDGHVLGPSAALGGPGAELPSEFSQHSPRKERKCPSPLLQAMGTTRSASLFQPTQPGLGNHLRAQFCGGRERSCEQGHSMYETPRRPSLWAVEALPTRLVGHCTDELQSGCQGPGRDSNSHWLAPENLSGGPDRTPRGQIETASE